MPPEKKTPPKNSIRTYKEDMAMALRESQGGAVRKLIDENNKKGKNGNASPTSKNKLFILGGIILILVSVGTLYAFFFLKKDIETVDVKPTFTPVIFTDLTDFASLDGLSGDQVASAILEKRDSSPIREGAIKGLYLTENKKVITFDRFVELAGWKLRVSGTDLVDSNFFTGVVGGGSARTSDVFFLLKIQSVADIFQFMRNWESEMFNDLHTVLGVELTEENEYLTSKEFEDGVAENKNARILYDRSGRIIVMYAFLDDNHMIVTNSIPAVREAILRLSTGEIRK